jgi:RNA polymerase sigma factor (sigma-70 family)
MAEDVVQTAYERAIRYKEATNARIFDAWFSTVLNNCLRDAQNEEKGYSYQEEGEETTEDVSCPHYPTRIMKEIFELIDTKSVIQQEVLGLYFKKQYTNIDISDTTAHSRGNIRQIISRFRQELKELYG